MVNVELVYIPAQGPIVHLHLTVRRGSTIAEVIELSGLQGTYPEVAGMAVGIFAKALPVDTIVKTGDRIEIYRPLLSDPKEKRRQRAHNRTGAKR